MIRPATALIFVMSASLRAEEPRKDRFGDPVPAGAVARLGTVNAHPYASTVAFSADGRTIITTSGAAVRHWDAESGRVRRTIALPGNPDTRRVSADGRIGATLTKDGLEIYDLEHDRLLHRVSIGDRKGLFGISPSGDLVLIRHEEAKDMLVIRDGKLESWAGVVGDFQKAVFSADGKWVALGIKLWQGRGVFRGTGPVAPAVELDGFGLTHAVAPDGSTLVADAEDENADNNNVALIETRTGRPVPGAEFALSGAPRAACFSADGQLLAVASDKEVTLWDVATKKRRWSATGRAGHLAFSPDGRRLAGIDHLLTVWDVSTGKTITPDFGPLPNYLISEAPRHNRIVMLNNVTGHFQVWDWTMARVCFSTEFGHYGLFTSRFTAGWLSADGAQMYLCAPRKAQAWEIATGKLLREFNPTPSDLANEPWESSSGQATPDGAAFSVLFVDRSKAKEQLRCVFVHWEANTGKLLFRRELELPQGDFVGITEDAWGIYVSVFPKSDRVFDARTGRERPPAYLPGQRFLIGAYTRDDAVFAGMDVFEAASRKSILRVPIADSRLQHAGIASVWRSSAITPDGRWAAFALRDGIELWDVIEQRQIPFHPPMRRRTRLRSTLCS